MKLTEHISLYLFIFFLTLLISHLAHINFLFQKVLVGIFSNTMNAMFKIFLNHLQLLLFIKNIKIYRNLIFDVYEHQVLKIIFFEN